VSFQLDVLQPAKSPKPISSARARIITSNEKVSDGSQPPVTFDLSLSESAGSRSLHRLVGQFEFDWLPESKASQATSIQRR